MRWQLFLDDDRWPPGEPTDWASWEWVVARNVDDAIWYVEHYGMPYHIAFDHDLGAKKMTGMDFAVWLSEEVLSSRKTFPTDFSYSIHSLNPVGRVNIKNRMEWLLENWEKNRYSLESCS